MPEISHVRLAVPEQAPLNRILREGGTQSFPQWLYAEPGPEARILWWGVRGLAAEPPASPPDATAGLFPRPVDDWTDAPRALVVATVDVDRAIADLEPLLGADWHPAGTDEYLGASCHRMQLGRGELVLAQPSGEGYTAACLARWGEGPLAVAIDGDAMSGRPVPRSPLGDGPATWVRLGSEAAPAILFLASA
jgi:hypothetical protein